MIDDRIWRRLTQGTRHSREEAEAIEGGKQSQSDPRRHLTMLKTEIKFIISPVTAGCIRVLRNLMFLNINKKPIYDKNFFA
jgi:hypothetical protein